MITFLIQNKLGVNLQGIWEDVTEGTGVALRTCLMVSRADIFAVVLLS